MKKYEKCSIFIDKHLFLNNNLLESVSHENLTKDTVKININSADDYFSLSEALENKQYTIVNDGEIYLVDGIFADRLA